MKHTQTYILATLLLTAAACSKPENNQATNQGSKTEMPAMEKSMQAKPSAMLPNELNADDTTSTIEQDDSGRKVIYWEDPMVPGRRFSKSGQSPFMDMKLAPRYAE